MHYDVAAYHVRGMVHGLRSLGLDAGELLEQARIDPCILTDPEARLAEPSMLELWVRAEQRYGKPTFGLDLALHVPFGKLELIDYLIGSSSSAGVGLECLAHHAKLCSSGFTYSFEPRDTDDGPCMLVQLTHRYGTHLLPRALVEYLWTLVVSRLRDVCGPAFSPTLLWRQRPLGPVRAYREALGGTPELAEADGLLVPLSQWTLENARADPTLAALLEAHASDVCARLPPDGFEARLRAAVIEALHLGDPSLQNVSRRLGLSTRSLQRRVADTGNSFAELVEGVRREASLRYLSCSLLSLAEISALLAYSEPSAFGRAFRRWTGTTPAEFRRRRCEPQVAAEAAIR